MQLRLFLILLLLPLQLLAQNINYPQGTVSGTLPNGFRYILKQNATPANKIDIRLLVKAGSINEQKGEEGVAHFIEHMAFNGSKNYPERTAIKYWESLGTKFGIAINAFTGYDRTVYYLSIPADKAGKNIQKTLSIYADWANNLTFTKKNIEKERGIVLQECANAKELDFFAAAKKGYLPQLERIPIGSQKQIKKIDRKTILQFYKTWYAPKNITLIVVGDINPQQLQKTVTKLFGRQKNRGKTHLPFEQIAYKKSTILKTQLDTTATELKMHVIFPVEYINAKNISQALKNKQNSFVLRLLQNRLSQQNIPVNISKYWYLLKTDFLEINTSGATDTALYNNYKKTFAIIESAKQKGFFADEVKDNLKEFTNSLKKQAFDWQTADWCDKFVEMDLFNEKHIWNKNQHKKLAELLEKTTLKQWQQITNELFKSKKIVLFTHNKTENSNLSLKQLLQAEQQAKLHIDTLFKYEKVKGGAKIIVPDIFTKAIPFSPRMIKAENYYPSLKLTEVILQNGVQILFRKTDSNDKKVNVSIVANGGLSLIKPSEYWKYGDVAAYMDLGGIKGVANEKYGDILWQENLTFVNTIENYYHGCMFSGSPKKGVELCNLMYHKIMNPELCYADFEEIRKEELKSCDVPEKESAWSRNLLIKMDGEVERFSGNVFPYAEKRKTKAQINALNLDSIANFHKTHFATVNKLHCIVLGNYNQSFKQNIIGTLSRLPKADNIKQYFNSTFAFPHKVQQKHIGNLNDKRLHFRDVYYGDFEVNLRNELTLKLMRDLLRNRLIHELREVSSLIYSPFITLKYRINPTPFFYFSIDGTTDPVNGKKVRNIVRNILKKLKVKTVDKSELNAIKQSFIIAKKEHLGGDNLVSWKDYLLNAVKENISIKDIANYEIILKSISAKDIRNAFEKMLLLQNETYFYVGEKQ